MANKIFESQEQLLRDGNLNPQKLGEVKRILHKVITQYQGGWSEDFQKGLNSNPQIISRNQQKNETEEERPPTRYLQSPKRDRRDRDRPLSQKSGNVSEAFIKNNSKID